jgi:hypothetical protein
MTACATGRWERSGSGSGSRLEAGRLRYLRVNSVNVFLNFATFGAATARQ